jgi:hypothetical protein
MSKSSRIWIFQNTFEIETEIVEKIKKATNYFVHHWVSHQNKLASSSLVLYNRFIVLIVDESIAGASGCSIDKSMAFIKSLEVEYGLSLLDRMNFAFLDSENNVQSLPKDAFRDAYTKGIIDDNTLVFNNLVDTMGALESNWKVALKDSWHKRLI